MATLGRWQATVVDDLGSVQPGAQVTVRRELPGQPLAPLFSDRAGIVSLPNPFTLGSDGFVAFHVAGGAYQITATRGAFSRTWRYVPIGIAAETDGSVVAGLRFRFNAGTTVADPGLGNLRFNNVTPASANLIMFNDTSADGANVETYINSFDDGGTNSNRGILTIQSANAVLVAQLVSTISDGGTFTAAAFAPIASFGTFVPGEFVGVQYAPRGADGVSGAGTGDVVGPASAVAGRIATFNGTTGKLIADSGILASGVAAANVGQGKQLLAYVPAGAMIPRITNGAALASFQLGTGAMVRTLDYDGATGEFAQFGIAMPKKWNEGTITYQALWIHPATTVNFGVSWKMNAVGVGDNETIDAARGTAIEVVDTGGVTNNLYVSPESAALTVLNAAENDYVIFEIARDPAAAGDTMTVDARLVGVRVFFTTNAVTEV